MRPDERIKRLAQGLAEARQAVSPHYDDVFRETQRSISAAGSAGKADIAILSFGSVCALTLDGSLVCSGCLTPKSAL